MMNILIISKKWYDRLEEYLIVAFLVVTTLLIFYQVVMRYVFNDSPIWTEEIARFMYVWESWLGISLTQKYGRHIKIEVLIGKLKEAKLSVILIIADIITIVICFILVKYGIQVTELIYNLKQTSSGTRFPMWIVYSAVPVSCGLMILRLLGEIWKEAGSLLPGRKKEV